MPIVKITNYVEYYRHLATLPDIHSISGRGDDVAATKYVNSRILAALDPSPDDVLLDVGCGDGCLLEMAKGRAKECIGVVPTGEEQSIVHAAVPGVRILVGLAQALPLESGSVSKVSCNSVFLYLESENAVLAAMKEIGRVARPKALIFIGEIPAADELTHFGKYKGDSVIGFLRHQLRQSGPRAFMGAAKTVALSSVGKATLLLNSATIFHASPERFIAMAEKCGLKHEAHFKHMRLDRSGAVVESPLRYSYIFSKNAPISPPSG